MTDDELIEALRARLDAMAEDFDRQVFMSVLLKKTGYCAHCGGKYYERWAGSFICYCQRND